MLRLPEIGSHAAFLPPFHMAQINFTRWLGRSPSHRWMRCSTVWLHSWTYTVLYEGISHHQLIDTYHYLL